VVFQFLMNYGSVIVELSRLTGMRFINPSRKSEKPIEQFVRRTLDFHNQKKYDLRDFEFAKIKLLVKNLQEIEKYDKTLLAKINKQLLNSLNENEYYGTRFEISITASLIRKGIDFTKTESPDFTINAKRKIFIECTSSHLTVRKTGDVKYKIKGTINFKSCKKYCNPETALFVDVTNLYYHSLLNEIDLEKKDVHNYAKRVLQGTKFGGIVFFVYLQNFKLDRYEQNYVRVDNDCMNAVLRDFLDRHYPFGNKHVDTHRIPKVG